MYKRRNVMIALIILLVVLNTSNTDAETLDELTRNGYAAYSIGQFEEAKEILDNLQTEYPNSHLGHILQVLIKIKEGDNRGAERLLVEFNNICNMNSSSCDSPSIHVIAKTIQGKMFDSESAFREVDEMIKGLSNELYKDCYETQIDIYLSKGNPQKACEACDEYVRISENCLYSDIALKCFIANWSCFRNKEARRLWSLLSPIQRDSLRGIYKDLRF
jgi:tetratricopeptide (TPR) repeat protein